MQFALEEVVFFMRTFVVVFLWLQSAEGWGTGLKRGQTVVDKEEEFVEERVYSMFLQIDCKL